VTSTTRRPRPVVRCAVRRDGRDRFSVGRRYSAALLRIDTWRHLWSVGVSTRVTKSWCGCGHTSVRLRVFNRPGSIYWCRLVSYFECNDRIHRVIVVSRVRATIRALFVVHSWSRPVVNVRGPGQSTSERTRGLHLQVEDIVTGPEQQKAWFPG